MTPMRERPAFEGTPPRARSRPWPRYTLGSLLAFIAGMAVMLAMLLPFIPWASPRSAITKNPHAGIGADVTSQNCASCHAAATPAPTGAPTKQGTFTSVIGASY